MDPRQPADDPVLANRVIAVQCAMRVLHADARHGATGFGKVKQLARKMFAWLEDEPDAGPMDGYVRRLLLTSACQYPLSAAHERKFDDHYLSYAKEAYSEMMDLVPDRYRKSA